MLAVELFRPEDLPALRTLMADYLREFAPDDDPAAEWDDPFYTAWLAGVQAGTHTIWLARKDGNFIGFALVRCERHWYRRTRVTGVIDEFYIAPQHRRHGFGRALVARAVAALRDQGIEVITANVVQMNLRALLFWQQVGFKIEAYHLFLQVR